MATREKIQRTKKVGVPDMQKVQQLLNWRALINSQLEGIGLFCSLYPDPNKKVCKICPEDIRDKCFKYGWERNFIHKNEATKANKRRKRKQDNPKYMELEISVRTDDDKGYEYQADSSEENTEDQKYPCQVMNFACPAREKCNYGENCEYKPD